MSPMTAFLCRPCRFCLLPASFLPTGVKHKVDACSVVTAAGRSFSVATQAAGIGANPKRSPARLRYVPTRLSPVLKRGVDCGGSGLPEASRAGGFGGFMARMGGLPPFRARLSMLVATDKVHVLDPTAPPTVVTPAAAEASAVPIFLTVATPTEPPTPRTEPVTPAVTNSEKPVEPAGSEVVPKAGPAAPASEVPEPVAKVPGSAAQAVSGPASGASAPVSEPAPEPAPEPASEPKAEPAPEPKADPAVEPVPEPTAEAKEPEPKEPEPKEAEPAEPKEAEPAPAELKSDAAPEKPKPDEAPEKPKPDAALEKPKPDAAPEKPKLEELQTNVPKDGAATAAAGSGTSVPVVRIVPVEVPTETARPVKQPVQYAPGPALTQPALDGGVPTTWVVTEAEFVTIVGSKSAYSGQVRCTPLRCGSRQPRSSEFFRVG